MNIPSQKKSSYGGRHLGFILTLLEVFIGCLIQNIFSANQIHKTTSCGFMDFIGSPREVTQVKLNAEAIAGKTAAPSIKKEWKRGKKKREKEEKEMVKEEKREKKKKKRRKREKKERREKEEKKGGEREG